MNTRFAKVGAVSSLLTLAAFCAVHTLRSQTLAPPPIKMGLWQTESNATVSGMENTPMGKAMSGQHGSVTQGCLTPDTWKSSLEKMQSQVPKNDCKVSNFRQDSNSVSFDEVCAGARNNSSVHFNAIFDDDEHMHGTVKMVMTADALPQGMTMNMDIKSHYLSSSCGDIKPGEGKVIHAQ
jgi:hypothetical protein